MDNDNIRPVLLPTQPTIHNMLYGTATQLQRTASILAAMNIRDRIVKGKGKGSFYIAQYPVRWTAQSALHFLPSLTDLFIPTPFSASPGSILARQQLHAKTKSLTFPPLKLCPMSNCTMCGDQER